MSAHHADHLDVDGRARHLRQLGEDNAQQRHRAFHDQRLARLILCEQGLPVHVPGREADLAYISVGKVAATMTLRIFDV